MILCGVDSTCVCCMGDGFLYQSLGRWRVYGCVNGVREDCFFCFFHSTRRVGFEILLVVVFFFGDAAIVLDFEAPRKAFNVRMLELLTEPSYVNATQLSGAYFISTFFVSSHRAFLKLDWKDFLQKQHLETSLSESNWNQFISEATFSRLCSSPQIC